MKYAIYTLLIPTLFFFSCDNAPVGKGITQLNVARVEKMPNLPEPYEYKDWRQTALAFDSIVYDFKATGPYFPLIWIDSAHRNFPQNTYGLFTAIGDVREGPQVNNGENHEAIGALGSIIGASLVGIDKSNQHGYDFVGMTKNYFNKENGWNVIMNFTSKRAHIGGGYGNDYWYEIFNNVLFYGVGHFYPKTEGFDTIMRTIADQFLASLNVPGMNFEYSFFDFSKMQGGKNHIPTQEDVAAGYAFVLYGAYQKFGDVKYRDGAIRALKILEGQRENRNYELFMPFGAYVAARLNAEAGQNFDVMKFLNWTFDGTATNREGWGVIVDRWGDYDVCGMQGSTVHNGGYGFAMNTFDLAWPLLPMVRYDQRYARAIGKWALNAANTARFFYTDGLPDSLQALPHRKDLTRNVIAYEGLIKESLYPEYKGRSPFAQGDGPLWAKGMPPETMFSVYGSGHVGIFGGTIRQTDVDRILLLDCNATDMFTIGKFLPTCLLYNPYKESKTVTVPVGDVPVKIYDAVSQKVINNKASGQAKLTLEGDRAYVLVLIPVDAKLSPKDGKLLAGDVVVDYRFSD